jgi:H+/Cl- antiporter ClcA
MADAPAAAEPTPEQVTATMRSRQFVVVLVFAAVVGVLVSLAAWCFLEGTVQIQKELYTHLPHAFGYSSGAPVWWSLPVLAIAGVIVAVAILYLPGKGGHIPARGLASGDPPLPIDLPGILLAGLVSIGFGVVIGPEGPLIALGTGFAVLTLKAIRRDTPPPLLLLIGACGSFAAISFIFASPVIAAVLMIEVAGLGGPRLTMLLIPGLLAAGIGTLVSIGMGSFTGLPSSAYALEPIVLPHFGHPTLAEFAWTIPLAVAIALVARLIIVGGLKTLDVVSKRLLLALPIVGLIIAGLAIAFHGATGKDVNEVLFSGESALPGLATMAKSWSVGTLALLVIFKGIGYMLSIGSFRGGPTFPAVFLGATAGLMASHLPGFSLEPAMAVGMAAGTVAILRLPLSAVVLATLLTAKSGTGDEPLIIVGVVVAFLVTLAVSGRPSAKAAPARAPAGAADATR